MNDQQSAVAHDLERDSDERQGVDHLMPRIDEDDVEWIGNCTNVSLDLPQSGKACSGFQQ
ncbi:MAG: hypothetical protein ACKOHN_06955 [Actinomycetota bacterium]